MNFVLAFFQCITQDAAIGFIVIDEQQDGVVSMCFWFHGTCKVF
jgi:hypothetical protein